MSTSLRVQLGNVVHVHPPPLIAVTVKPVGALSVTVTRFAASLSPAPALVTTTE